MLLTNPFRPDPRVDEEAKVLVSSGYDVTILCWDRGEGYPEREEINGIKIWRISVPAGYGRPKDFIKGISLFYFKSLKLLRKKEFHVVHAHDFDTLPLAIILKKLRGWKVVYDAHDHYTSMIRDVLPHNIANILRKLEKKLVEHTDRNIAATRELGKLIFNDIPFETIMNAKNLSDFEVNEEKVQKFRDTLNPDNKFLIVYIGILKLWTPLPQIIQAVKSMPEVLLIIGGDGPHKKEILDMIEKTDNIKYLGWISKKEIPLYTSVSDVIILPSNPKKDYTRVAVANKLMEALAAGKPIIAGKGTAGGRVVEECKAGFLCEFGDVKCLREKIRYLMENEDLRRKYGENARKCAERKYNWSIMARKLLNLYSNL